MGTLISLLILLLNLYLWVIILTVVVSWLVAFDVLNVRNRYVAKFCNLLNALSEPLFRRLRRV